MPAVQNASVALEVAHIHAPERLVALRGLSNDGSFRWCPRALDASLRDVQHVEDQLAQRPEVAGHAVTRLSLLDDVVVREAQRVSAESWRWELFIRVSRQSVEQGTSAVVHLESSFVAAARELHNRVGASLARLGIAMDDRGQARVPTDHGVIGIRLCGFHTIADPTHPSCTLLDLAWTAWRCERYAHTFTALPLGYYKQQLQVAALAALIDLPGRDRVTTLFMDRAARFKGELCFGDVTVLKEGAEG